MARSFCYLIVFPLTCLALGSWAQRSPYSLQTAVDELHHWDAAKFPLNAPPSQPNYYRSALGSSSDQDYWDDDNGPSSVFRERDSQAVNGNSELTQQFLREIEETQEHEREQRYKSALRHILDNYQPQQDNDVDNKLFDEQKHAKQKRSTDEQINTNKATGESTTTTTTTTDTTTSALATAMNDMRLEMPLKTENNATVTGTASNTTATAKATGEHHHAGHNNYHAHQHDHKHNKRSNHHSGEDEHESDEEEEEDSEEHGEHDEHEDDEDDEEFGDEEDEERKKKRDVSAAKQTVPGSDQIMKRRKKSIQWSKYFGIDRKKKAMQMDKKFIKRSASQDSVERDVNTNNLSSDKLKSMDKKLQSIEDMIIDETIKYTGAHEGITNPADIRRLKDHVLSRLATAYSLEKMRLALDKLRQSVDSENHLLRNVIESEPDGQYDSDLAEYANQLVKKEKSDVPDKNRQYDVLGDNDKKHKNKRTNYQRYPELTNNDLTDYQTNRYGNLNDAYLGNKNYIAGSNQCPLIESMAERCRGIDILSGDLNQDLLPICGVHQICYLCGTSQISCDYQYLGEADAICGNNDACQAAARTILMILRGSPGPQLGPRECEKSSCLYSAMREIGL